MKRRKFMLSTGLVGASTLLIGAELSSIIHDTSNWNYPDALSNQEIEHVSLMADSLVPHIPETVSNKKKFVRNLMEPQRILEKEYDENGYRTTFLNKNGQKVLIYQKAGQRTTQFIKA